MAQSLGQAHTAAELCTRYVYTISHVAKSQRTHGSFIRSAHFHAAGRSVPAEAQQRSQDEAEKKALSASTPAATDTTMRVHERKRKSASVMLTYDTILNDVAASPSHPRRLVIRRSTTIEIRVDNPAKVKPPRRTFSFHNFTGALGNIRDAAERLLCSAGKGRHLGAAVGANATLEGEGIFIRHCEEPEETPPECSGDCVPFVPRTKAHVVRLSPSIAFT